MGKNAQRRRQAANGDLDPANQVDHFILNTDGYVALRRYLGSRPFDETAQLIQVLEQAAVVSQADVEKRKAHAERLQELEDEISLKGRFMVGKGTVLEYLDQFLGQVQAWDDGPDMSPAGLYKAIDGLRMFRERLELNGEEPEPGSIVDNPDEEPDFDPDGTLPPDDAPDVETTTQEGA